MDDLLQACTEFLQRLIQTPSMPGEEGALARLVVDEMQKLGYDEVRVDEAGNVIGKITGKQRQPALMFATHLDHVDVGKEEDWPYPPFSGTLAQGRIWGRGAVDIKGPLAAQVYGVAQIVRDNQPPETDVYVVATVQEEIGGVGARHLLTHLRPPLVIVGEPSRNELRHGHRGRMEYVVHIRGKSVHASVPEKGVNPLDVLARFLLKREAFPAGENPHLGRTTLAPTLIRTDQQSANVIPGALWQTIDCRYVPEQTPQDIAAILDGFLEDSLIPGASVRLHVPRYPRRTYTGLEMEIPADNPPYLLPPEHPLLRAAVQVMETLQGHPPRVGIWQFATDGGHFARAGLKVVGIGPGDEGLAHTVHESLALEELEQALRINEALARHLVLAYEALRRGGT